MTSLKLSVVDFTVITFLFACWGDVGGCFLLSIVGVDVVVVVVVVVGGELDGLMQA